VSETARPLRRFMRRLRKFMRTIYTCVSESEAIEEVHEDNLYLWLRQ